jgi:hypothetical protein
LVRTMETKLGFVVAGLLLGIFIASMDNTIVSTATGTIVAELGGLDNDYAEGRTCKFS